MSSTHSHGKLVAAVQSADGTNYYIMFEMACSSNVSPRIPTWHCYSLGNLETTMAAIFRAASYCEGGMLKGAGGRSITPEGYIAGWLKELANPVMISDQEIDLCCTQSYYANVPLQADTERFDAFKQRLGTSDRALEIIAALEDSCTATVSLHQDIDLLVAVCAADRVVYPGNLFPYDYAPEHSLRDDRAGYAPAKVKLQQADVYPTFMRVAQNNDHVLRQQEDGIWRNAGYESSVIQGYVDGLWEQELKEPGTYRKRIAGFRREVTSAPVLPTTGVTAILDTAALTEKKLANLDWSLQKLVHTRHGDEIHVSVSECDDLWHVTSLPEHATRWVFDTAPVAPATREQMSLAV